jgi:hypothetical protein
MFHLRAIEERKSLSRVDDQVNAGRSQVHDARARLVPLFRVARAAGKVGGSWERMRESASRPPAEAATTTMWNASRDMGRLSSCPTGRGPFERTWPVMSYSVRRRPPPSSAR